MAVFEMEGVEPRKAAAAIVYCPERGEVLMGQRNTATRFMGGHHVFPGGSLDSNDAVDCVENAPDDETARAIVAAAREVFEETGLLLARGGGPSPEEAPDLRRMLERRKADFPALLRGWGATLHAEDFEFAGLWITPPISPIRFHTHYFLCHYHGPRTESVLDPDGEIVALEWLSPRAARRRWHDAKLKLSVPVAFVLQHLEMLPVQEALPWLRRTPGHEGELPHRFEMRRGIHMLPLASSALPPATHTNTMVIGQERLLILDPGPEDPVEQGYLKGHLDHLLALDAQIEAIVLSHSHPDHTGALKFLQDAYGAPVWAHAATGQRLGIPLDRALNDGDVLRLPGDPGWTLTCLHTPGHDPGHLAFVEHSTRSMLAGDLIANPGTIVVSPEWDGDMDAYLASLGRLLEQDFSFLVPAHGMPIFGSGGKEKIEETIAHRLERERRIKDAFEGGAHTMQALLEVAYADKPKEIWPIAEHQIKAHLKRLKLSLA
ncbi:MAG: MBL fold metallo-hydrolase [Candidatus Hydrogenedentes bacterium]|nr:MBL fold metallo-hydrolase [Candidatus Hydrogenedentota bacterium]